MESQKEPKLGALGKTLLIVEDEEINYLYLKELVRIEFKEIYWAKDGEEAMRFFYEKKPDLVLMDIKMPRLNGMEAFLMMKEVNPKIPIIAQTAYAMANDRQDILAAGFDDYLAKPITRDDLFKVLMKHLKQLA